MNNIQIAYEQVRKFNQIAGNLNGADLDGIAHQIEFIDSELDEAWAGYQEQDMVEVVDGACDLFVTVAGLMQRLEAAGVNIEKALARVNENNLSKFPTTHVHENDATLQPEDTDVVFTDYGHVVYKRKHDGKVMKPTNFVSVDITSCVPTDLFVEAE